MQLVGHLYIHTFERKNENKSTHVLKENTEYYTVYSSIQSIIHSLQYVNSHTHTHPHTINLVHAECVLFTVNFVYDLSN